MNQGRAILIDITPKMAAAWLADHEGRQRAISPKTVQKYAEDMKAGRWSFTGETIIIGSNGDILDGRHRLSAIVDSGVTMKWIVVKDVDPEAMLHIDTGKRRTMGDILKIVVGVESSNSVASTLSAYFVIEAGGDAKPSPSSEEYLEMYEKHKDDIHWAISTITTRLEAGGFKVTSGCGPVWGAFAYMRHRNPKLVEAMAERFRTMKGLTPRDNAATLRSAVIGNANRGSQEVRRDLLASALQCIEAELNGKKVTVKQLDSSHTVFARINRSRGRGKAAA